MDSERDRRSRSDCDRNPKAILRQSSNHRFPLMPTIPNTFLYLFVGWDKGAIDPVETRSDWIAKDFPIEDPVATAIEIPCAPAFESLVPHFSDVQFNLVTIGIPSVDLYRELTKKRQNAGAQCAPYNYNSPMLSSMPAKSGILGFLSSHVQHQSGL